jgi:hypothetical protein
MSGVSQTGGTVSELVQQVKDTGTFLRMAALELRRIANETPDVAAQLCHIATQLEAEVEALARRDWQIQHRSSEA